MTTHPRRRVLLGMLGVAGAAGLGGCGVDLGKVRVDRNGSLPPTRSPDDEAREAAVRLLQSVQAQRVSLSTAAAPIGTLVTAQAKQTEAALAALGPLPSASASASATSTASVTAASHQLAVTAGAATILASAPPCSGPLARVLVSVAAGLAVQGRSLAPLVRRPIPALPRLGGPVGLENGRFAASLIAPVGPEEAVPAGIGVSASVPASATATTSVPATTEASASPTTAGTGSPMEPPQPQSVQEAVLAALATHRAAEFGYGLLAVRLAGAERTTAMQRLSAHRWAAYSIEALATKAALDPPEPAPDAPEPLVSNAAQARALAAKLESACATAAGTVIALLVPGESFTRNAFADEMVTCGAVAARWGSRTALPGIT